MDTLLHSDSRQPRSDRNNGNIHGTGIPTPDRSPARSLSEASAHNDELLENTGPRILVTGGVGYIGSHTVVELLAHNYRVVIVDNLSNAQEDVISRIRYVSKRKIYLHIVDITNQANMENVFDLYNNDFAAVIHFAALKALGESNVIPLEYYHVNVTVVYGDPEITPESELVAESSPTDLSRITNPYGRTKRMAEEIIIDLCRSDPSWYCILLRYFNPTGAHTSGFIGEDPAGEPNNLMPYVTQVVQGRRSHLNVFGGDYDTKDGTGIRDYIHVMDLATGHVAALDKLLNTNFHSLQNKCPAYNLGSGCGYSVLDIVKTISRVTGKNVPYVFTDKREGDVAKVVANASLAKTELGWSAKRNLDDMCSSVWKWLQLWHEREIERLEPQK